MIVRRAEAGVSVGGGRFVRKAGQELREADLVAEEEGGRLAIAATGLAGCAASRAASSSRSGRSIST